MIFRFSLRCKRQLVPGECNASPLGYRSGDTASGKKTAQGVLVFGEFPQAGLDDAFSPIEELVDLQKLEGLGIISQARQQFTASLQNLRKLQPMQHFQSLNQSPQFIKVSNGKVAFLFRHHLLLHPDDAGFQLQVYALAAGEVRRLNPPRRPPKTRTVA